MSSVNALFELEAIRKPAERAAGAGSSVNAPYELKAMHKPHSSLPLWVVPVAQPTHGERRPAAQGIGGVRSSHAAGGAGAIAESRKARSPRSGDAPKRTGYSSYLNLFFSFSRSSISTTIEPLRRL
jgi:hypothetical protein